MVKVINIILENSEHEELTEKKGSKTWKECLVDGAKNESK